jgi:hypothetical protein
MKKRILFLFCIVLVVNFIFTVLLNSENLIERTDMVALLIGSYIVYWVINIYLYIQIKVKNTLGYSLTLIVGLMVNIVALFVLIFNITTDKAIYIPLMYVISMLLTFLNWFIFDKKGPK